MSQRAVRSSPVPLPDDTDLQILTPAQSERFWKLLDSAVEQGEEEARGHLEDVVRHAIRHLRSVK